MLKIALIDNFPAFCRCAPFWNRLLEKSDIDIPFMTYEWLDTLWRCYLRKEKVMVLVFTQDSEPVAAVPLKLVRVIWRGLPVTQLCFLSHFRTGLIDVSGENVLDLAVRFLWEKKTPFDMMYFDFIESGSRTSRYINEFIDSSRLSCRMLPGQLSPYLRLEQGWDAYLRTRSDNFRDKWRRTGNALGKEGDYRLARYSAPGDVPEAMEKVLSISRRTWKFKSRTAIASSPSRILFHTELARAAAGKGWLRILLISDKETPVAFIFELRYNGTVFFLKTGFDESYANRSPGFFIICQSIKEAFEDGYAQYDMLGKNEGFKMKFTSLVREHSKFLIFNRTLAGRFLYFVESKLVTAAKFALRKPALSLGQAGEDPESGGTPHHKTGREKVITRK